MNFLVVAVRDQKADQFLPPQVVQSRGVAIRMFADVVNNASEQNLIYKHPEDFALWQIGEFDPDTGLLVHVEHEQLSLATDHVVKESAGLRAVN